MKTGSKNKAKVAIANRLARSIFYILSDKNLRYKELGSHHVIDEQRQIKHHIAKLVNLGIEVNLVTKEKIEAVANI